MTATRGRSSDRRTPCSISAVSKRRRSMAVILINGQELEIGDDERLNGIQAAQRLGIEIPHYCWHPGLSVVASCRMCLVETGRRDPQTGEITMLPKLVPACQTPADRRHGLRHQQREGPRGPGHGRRGPADSPSDRLPDLRQGGRVPAAGLPLPARPAGAAGRHEAVHQPPPPGGRHGDAVRRPLRDVQPLRPVHPRDHRDRAS